MVPPRLREPHRRAACSATSRPAQSKMINHPIEIEAMRKDGSEFPVELAITRPELPGPPLFCGYIRDVTERRKRDAALRRLADEQAALRRVATAVAAEPEPSRVFGVVTEEVGRLLGRTEREHGPLRRRRAADRRRRLERAGRAQRAGRRHDAARRRHGRRARLADRSAGARGQLRRTWPGKVAERLRELGFRGAVAAPVTLGGRRVGRRDRLDRQARAVPARRRAAARRLRRAGGSGARQRQLARAARRVARADRRGRRRRAPPARAQPARRRAAAARRAVAQPAPRRPRLPRRSGGARRRSSAPARSSPRRSRSCASSRAGSIPPCSATAAWSRRSRRWPRARRCRCRSTSGSRSVCPSRSRRPPTTWWPRRSPTRPSTRRPTEVRVRIARDNGMRVDRGRRRRRRRRRHRERLGPARPGRPRRGARRPPAHREPAGEGTTVLAEIPAE